MKSWFSKKDNIYAIFTVLFFLGVITLSIVGPLRIIGEFDAKALEKIVKPSIFECSNTLKEGGIALKAAREICEENNIRQMLRVAAVLIFASPVVLLNVKKEILESSKSRVQRLGASETVNALERMEQLANLASLSAVPLATFLLVQVIRPFNIKVFGDAVGWIMLLAGIGLAVYISALLTSIIASWFVPSTAPVGPNSGQPAALSSATSASAGTTQTAQGQTAPPQTPVGNNP